MSNPKQKLDPVITYKLIFAAMTTGWEEAARIYGSWLKSGGTQAALRKAGPMAPSVWQALDALYHDTIDPRTLLMHIRAKTALMGMPKVEQAYLHDHGVQVLGAGGTSQWKKLEELLPAQMRLVFNGHVVRSIAQQQLIMRAPKVLKTGTPKKGSVITLAYIKPPHKYEIVGHNVRVPTDPTVTYVEFTLDELMAIVTAAVKGR